MTQNLLTNSIFANLDITPTGDSIIVNNEELGVDPCIPSKNLKRNGRRSASCSTYQIIGLGEEGMNGLDEKWRSREFPTCEQVSVHYTLKIPDEEGYTALNTSPLLESSVDGGIDREYGAILTRENTRRKASRTCTLMPSGLFKQVEDGFEAVMTGRTNASFE
ncbi:hypothetical protein V865_005835 [Kwoniella europaea PYCC6329]|uniref:Transcription factor TFIIIC triple barrel domain-containing protein n=1 Tax=Kwoniella europaea PYCC6329 TaxID=1423913 RepID=A0AAX4KQV1_9TREE